MGRAAIASTAKLPRDAIPDRDDMVGMMHQLPGAGDL